MQIGLFIDHSLGESQLLMLPINLIKMFKGGFLANLRSRVAGFLIGATLAPDVSEKLPK